MTKKKVIKPKVTNNHLQDQIGNLARCQASDLYDIKGNVAESLRRIRLVGEKIDDTRAAFQPGTFWLGFLSGLSVGLIIVALK